MGSKFVVKLGIALVSLAAGVGLLELGLKAAGYGYSPLSIEVGGGSDWRSYHCFRDRNFEWDPDLLWRPRAGHSVFNSQGFRGAVLAAEKPGAQVRVFALGDSNTLGWAGDGPAWPTYLEEELRGRADREVVVTNASAWGWSSYQGRVRMEELAAYQPDLVLVSFGANDAHPVTVPDAEYDRIAGQFRYAAYRSRVAQLVVRTRMALGGRTAEASEEPRPLRARVELDSYRDNLRAIVSRCRELGATPVLLTRPYIGETEDPRNWKSSAARYREATLEVARETGSPAVDVYSLFDGLEDLFADESHFTEAGHRRAAALLAAELGPLL